MIGVTKMKNKVLTTFMATAITATLVSPMPTADAASNNSPLNHSIQMQPKQRGKQLLLATSLKRKFLHPMANLKLASR